MSQTLCVVYVNYVHPMEREDVAAGNSLHPLRSEMLILIPEVTDTERKAKPERVLDGSLSGISRTSSARETDGMSQENGEVFSKDTFLTSLRNGASQNADATVAASGAKVAVEEPAGMALVREKHAQLHEVVGSLSEKISAVLGRQEKDFLAAYRAHMYNVQKELHELREKMHRNETVENKTEKIKKIEEERDWYRKEALRLDAFTTSMTKDLKYMREKLEAIEEDRNWLEKQLKACKKQNKLLRAELDVRVSSGAPSNAFDISQLPSFDSPKANGSRRSVTKKSSEEQEDENGGGRQASLPALSGEPTTATATFLSPTIVEEREEKFRKQIRSLKKELQQKTQEVGSLRRQRLATNDNEARSHLENFFLQCVESVKDEVTRRRSHPAAHDKKDRAGGIHRTPMPSLADKMRNQKQDVGIEFEDFSAADRVRVIERLLAHDEVLTLLYEQLFPSEQKAGRATSSVRPVSTDGEGGRGGGGGMHLSDSTKSLPDATASPSTKRVSFEPPDASRAASQPAGSGAAAVSAVRSNGLPIDDSTRDYLRSMRLGSSS